MDAAEADRWVCTLAAGATHEQGGVRLLLLHPGVLVVGEGGRTALWAPTCTDLPDHVLAALDGSGLDAVVLRLPLDRPQALAHTVALLRRSGALQADGEALILADRFPARLRSRLAAWGVRVVASADAAVPPDRSATTSTGSVAGPAEPAVRTLVLGAAASGKSAAAEDLLAAEPDVVYAATGPAASPDPATETTATETTATEPGREGRDPEWNERVRRHRERRPGWWQTVEGADVAALLAQPGPPVLLDSLGTWVTGALERAGAWDDVPGWTDRYEQEVDRMVRAWRASRRRIVGVGEETGWGVVPPTRAGGIFRDALGTLTRRLADESERVLLVVAGRVIDLDAISEPNIGPSTNASTNPNISRPILETGPAQ